MKVSTTRSSRPHAQVDHHQIGVGGQVDGGVDRSAGHGQSHTYTRDSPVAIPAG